MIAYKTILYMHVFSFQVSNNNCFNFTVLILIIQPQICTLLEFIYMYTMAYVHDNLLVSSCIPIQFDDLWDDFVQVADVLLTFYKSTVAQNCKSH